MKYLLLALSVCLTILLIPGAILADVSVVQDSCVTVGIPPNANIWTYFSVVNFSLPSPVCEIRMIPEPQPPVPECVMLDLVLPGPNPAIEGSTGWSGVLNPDGGATFTANTSADCIAPGKIKRGFAFYLDPDFCCYVVEFTDGSGMVIHEQEECFTCQKVPVEERSWGAIKQYYR